MQGRTIFTATSQGISISYTTYLDLWEKPYLYLITIVIFGYSFLNQQIHVRRELVLDTIEQRSRNRENIALFEG